MGVLVLAGAGAAVALAGVGQRVSHPELLTHAVSALTIDSGGGDITVRTGGAPGTVEVIRKTRSTGTPPALGPTSWQGDTLVLSGGCQGCGDIDYEVTVPAGLNVTAKTGSGDLQLEGALGTVAVETGSGDIDADLTAQSLTTRTGSGDMALSLGNAPSQLTANSGSGDVDIRVPDDQSYAVSFRTGSGDRDINVPQQSTSDRKIDVQTGSGDISVSGR